MPNLVTFWSPWLEMPSKKKIKYLYLEWWFLILFVPQSCSVNYMYARDKEVTTTNQNSKHKFRYQILFLMQNFRCGAAENKHP